MLGQLGIFFEGSRHAGNDRKKRQETERMWILGHFSGEPKKFGESPMGLLSPKSHQCAFA